MSEDRGSVVLEMFVVLDAASSLSPSCLRSPGISLSALAQRYLEDEAIARVVIRSHRRHSASGVISLNFGAPDKSSGRQCMRV
jgi:hypothetical protein